MKSRNRPSCQCPFMCQLVCGMARKAAKGLGLRLEAACPQADRPAGRDRQCGGLLRLGRRESRAEFKRETKVRSKTNLKPSRPFKSYQSGRGLCRPPPKQPEGQNLRSKSAASDGGFGEKSSARTMPTALRRCMPPGSRWKQQV